MKLLGQQFTLYVRSKNGNDDAKTITDAIYFKSRDHFTDVTTGDKAILLTNSFFKNLFPRYEKFGEISSGVINFEPKHNHIVVKSTVSFERFILIHCIIFALLLPTIISIATESIVVALFVGVCFLFIIFIYPHFAVNAFKSLISGCIKECKFKMK